MTEKKRRIGDQEVKLDALSSMAHDVRLLVTEALPSKDIASFAQLARLFRGGWRQRTITIKEGEGFETTAPEAVAWLGDRIGHVRKLVLEGSRETYHPADVSAALGQFTGIQELDVGYEHTRLVARVLREGVFPQLRSLTYRDTDTNALIDALIDAPARTRETLVGWTTETTPTMMLKCPSDWLSRLETLRLDETAKDIKATSTLLRACSSLRKLNLSETYYLSATKIDNDWVAATFVEGCSRNLTHLHISSWRWSTLGLKGLQSIASHCPAMDSFDLWSSKPEDYKGEDWKELVPILRTWDSSLRRLTFNVLLAKHLPVEFFDETRMLCPLLDHIDVTIGKVPTQGDVWGSMLRWSMQHPLLDKQSSFFAREEDL